MVVLMKYIIFEENQNLSPLKSSMHLLGFERAVDTTVLCYLNDLFLLFKKQTTQNRTILQ